MEAHGAGLRRVLVLAFCVAGIWSAYIYQGVLQETVSTKRFGPNNERFEHLAFLNLAQNVVCLVWSFIMLKIWSNGKSGGAPWWSYWSAGPGKIIKNDSWYVRKQAFFYTYIDVLFFEYAFVDIVNTEIYGKIKRWIEDVLI
uniref:UDP-galactose/UDP-glucose transporter, putative n=1 Tax=Solanum demissum TaxID=50514 RepID=Q0KIT4_SOLDE|nr:UDP-galactose/UDP-glucose transporter, putative [Solanum demissum]